MGYLVIDLETTGIKSHGRIANPFDKKNDIVITILKPQGEPLDIQFKETTLDLKDDTVIVAHNMKFDLGYLYSQVDEWAASGGLVWDTSVAEYYLSGQATKYPSLDYCCKARGIATKPDETKHILKENKDQRGFLNVLDYDKDLAMEYCEGDGLNTEAVMISQVKEANDRGMLNLIKVQQRYQLATLEMENNGLNVDLARLSELHREYEGKLVKVREELEEWSSQHFPKDIEFLPGSTKHLSATVFGVPSVPVTRKVQQGFFKNGNPKMKNIIEDCDINVFNISPGTLEKTKKGEYPTGIKEWNELNFPTDEGKWFQKKIAEWRKLNKFHSTYIKPLIENIYDDSCIRGTFVHISTDTGRLSSRAPNLQNLDPAILDCMVSRFKDGMLVEIDFSQVEVIVAAYLSQDTVMMEEIITGLDMHTENASAFYGIPKEQVTKEQRKTAKFGGFRTIYGGNGAGLENDFDMAEGDGDRFIDHFYNKYNGLKDWHTQLVKEVASNEYFCEESNTMRSFLQMPYGKKYTYNKKWIEDSRRGVVSYFPKPTIKNYPVQGLAADLMAIAAYDCYLYCKKHNILMVNVVHDALLFDFQDKDLADLHARELCTIMESVSTRFEEIFDIKFNIPVKADISMGTSWGACK